MPAEICYMWHIYVKKYKLYKKDFMYRIFKCSELWKAASYCLMHITSIWIRQGQCTVLLQAGNVIIGTTNVLLKLFMKSWVEMKHFSCTLKDSTWEGISTCLLSSEKKPRRDNFTGKGNDTILNSPKMDKVIFQF